MSDSVRPHRQQPTRLPRPWDSPGKNTGVGHHFLLQCMKVKSESEVAQSCPPLSNPMDCSLPGSSIHGIFPGKSTGVGCHCLLDLDKGKENGKLFREKYAGRRNCQKFTFNLAHENCLWQTSTEAPEFAVNICKLSIVK